MEKTVLVTDASQRKSVPIIRSLGKRGVRVVAGEDARIAMGFFSRYSIKSTVYPAPEKEDAFVSWLIGCAKKRLFDILYPIDERTMEPVTRNLSELEKYMIVPVVDHPKFAIARSKSKTLALATKLNIPVPNTITIASEYEIRKKVNEAMIPAVIKAKVSSGSRGLAYVQHKEDLLPAYLQIHRNYPFPLIQELIPPGGDTFGVECLCDRGKILRTFVHRRIREFPITGGPSTLRESFHREDIIKFASQLLSCIGWHGVAMVEFKENPENRQCILMEINPKFWGSIALPICSGVDFPYLLYAMACGYSIGRDPGYKKHVKCRWLIPGDILHFLANPNRFRLRPNFFQFKGTNYDLLDLKDLGPLFGMFLSFCKQATKKAFWRKYLIRKN